MRLYTEVEAPRGTPLQALVGWGCALAVGVACWAACGAAVAWLLLHDAQVMWP